MATKSGLKAPRSPASGSVADLETVAHSTTGCIPKVQPDMAATRPNKTAQTTGEQAATDAKTRDYIDRSRKDLEFIKSKRGDAPAHVKKSRDAIAQTQEALSKAATKRPKMTDAEQSAMFERVGREHGAEGNEREFNEVLLKLAKAKS